MNSSPPNILHLTRRELLCIGGLSLIGGFLNPFRSFNVRAAEKVKPMGTARQVLFINIEGGMSQVDTLDAKEGAWTPDYFDIRNYGDLKLPYGLLKNLTGILDKITVARTLAAWDPSYWRGGLSRIRERAQGHRFVARLHSHEHGE